MPTSAKLILSTLFLADISSLENAQYTIISYKKRINLLLAQKKQSDKLHLTVHNRRVLILSDKMHKGDGGINTVWTTFSSFARKLSFFGSSSLIGI